MSFSYPPDQHALDVTVSELLVATADAYDPDLDRRITDVLLLLRKQLRMDVVFVSEFVDGERVFRFVDGGDSLGLRAGDAAPLEQTYCQRVVQGRIPELVNNAAPMFARGELPEVGFPVGAYLSTPVVLPDGRIYGTVCCLSTSAQPDLQVSALACLRQCARLVARKIEVQQQRADFAATQSDWSATQPLPLDPTR